MSIPFIDLQTQRRRIESEVNAAVARVLEHGQYILGPEVKAFEEALKTFEDANHVISCANGTDAIVLPLKAFGIGVGDAVFCPSYTYTATAEAIVLAGATPVFVDIEPGTYTLCAKSLEAAISDVKKAGDLTPRAVIAVELFGHPANYDAIAPVAKAEGLKIISDNAQSIGCRVNGRSTAHWADAVTTSFFPAKPLGCYGDGGAMLVKDEDVAETLLSLRFHGRGTEPYDHDKIGMNSRLDTIQAAILIEKLKIFPDEIEKRNQVANRYAELLGGKIKAVPLVKEGCVSTWAQYCIEVEDRDAFLAEIRGKGLPVGAYYPRPIHEQSAYTSYPVVSEGLTETNRVKNFAAALPMHPYLSENDQDMMVEAVLAAT